MMGNLGSILGWEDLLGKEMAIHTGILAWEIPWTGTWQATVHGVAKESDTTERLTLSLSSENFL